MSDDLKVIAIKQHDPRLGRQVVHDTASRRFPLSASVDRDSWRTVALRSYDPRPNPNQRIGNCTGCQKAMAFNTQGHRKRGRILGMAEADRIYSLATTLDPWDGSYPPVDTGSSGLAAAKAAQKLGYGGEYRWLFGGADEVVQALQHGLPVGIGAWWYEGGFNPKPEPGGGVRIEMTGRRVGGHQWSARAYDERRDLVGGRCWWGGFKDFWIRRDHLDELLADNGDAHVQAAA